MKFILIILILIISLYEYSYSGEESPPLAPPSTLALSLDDMILHFKIFVIADIYNNIITVRSSKLEEYFTLTDYEMNVLINEAIQKNPMLSETKSLQVFYYANNLFINLENLYFRCYRLEILPGEFEFKTEPVDKQIFLENLKTKNK